MIPALILSMVMTVATATATPAFTWPWSEADTPPAPPPRPVASLIVNSNIMLQHPIPGVIAARNEVTLGFQTLGRMTARNVDIGDMVKQGEILATLDPEDLEGNVRAARAAVEAARADLLTAQAAAQRTRELAQRNVAPQAQLEQAEQALSAAEAAERQAQSQLVRALDTQGYAALRAPFDGVVSAIFANPGAVVSAGEPVLRVSSETGLEAVIDLPDATISSVAQGDVYDVWSESDPGQVLQANVTQIEPMADAATRTRRVHLALPDNARIRLGALIRARPRMDAASQVVVPGAAILQRDGAPHVWVVERKNDPAIVRLRPIMTAGPTDAAQVAVTDGLRPGDEIVIRGIHSLSEGQPVGRSVTP